MATAQLDTGVYVPPFAGQTLATAVTQATQAVVQATTAALATTAAAGGVTFASVAGTGAPLTLNSAVNTINPTDAGGQPFSTSRGLTTDNYLDYFLIPYLQAHELSWPSYRYAYILWFIIAGLVAIWSIMHAVFRGHGGVVSALMRKGGVRRYEFGSSGKAVEAKPKIKGGVVYGVPEQKVVHRSKYATPTLGQMFSCLLILAAVFCVSYVGPDYLSPTECLFGGTCTPAVQQGPPQSTFRLLRARAGEADAETPVLPLPAGVARPLTLEERDLALAKRVGVYATNPLNPSGWAPFNDPLLAGTNTAVSKSLWTSSARTGLIAFALIPLVVTLALRLWPYAIFATPFLTNYSFDKTAIWHRWIGRLIWALSTVHVGLWTQQLFDNTDPYGRYIWFEVWQYWRFRAAVVGYAALTALTLLSFAPLRSRAYETFYYSHIVLVLITLFGCVFHFKNLQWWPIAGLVLWGAERLSRFVIWLYINGFFKGIGLFGRAGRIMDNRSKEAFSEKRLPPSPGLGYSYASPTAAQSDLTLADSYSFANSKSGLQSRPQSFYGNLPYGQNSVAELINPPPGYAVAQLLPGRTVRLTFRPPVTMHWRPGQHALVTIPKVSWWQSHPYTFASCDGTTVGEKSNDMTFIIRAKKGFSLALYKHVAALRRTHGAGVLVRTQISFPMGSAGRAHWGEYKSVLLVVGGTGVSFGLSVFDYVCHAMAARNAGKQLPGGRPFKTTQIHFLWILRDWAHLAWIAPTVQRCLQISQPGSVRVSLYVATNTPIGPGPSNLGTPAFAQSNSSGYFFDSAPNRPLRPDEMEGNVAIDSALDYVLFDGEEAIPTADENAASKTVKRRTALLRREKTKRKSNLAESTSAADLNEREVLYPPRPPGLRSGTPAGTCSDQMKRPPSLQTLPRSSSYGQNEKRWSAGSDATLAATYDDAYGSDRSRTGTPFREKPPSSPSASAVAFSLKGDADEALLDVLGADREALDQVAELAVEGRPKIEQVFRDEINRSDGSVIVGCCGPTSLNVAMRRLVADAISPARIARGDQRGNVDIVCEDFE